MAKFHIGIVGGSKVGKSAYIARLTTGEFVKSGPHGWSFGQASYETNYGSFSLNLMERDSLRDIDVDAVIVMADVTDLSTIDVAIAHLCDIPGVCILNKVDEVQAYGPATLKAINVPANTPVVLMSVKTCYQYDEPILLLLRALTHHPDLVFVTAESAVL